MKIFLDIKKLIKHLVVFTIGFLFVLEVYLRVNHLTPEIPQRTIEDGIQKYFPSQKGLWSSGSHAWEINKYGWPGPEPKNTENLITLIGDSHIENLMNPLSCHQATYLGRIFPAKSFLQIARSGATLIEYLEFSRVMNQKYNPDLQLIFVKESDFWESLISFGRRADMTQINLKTKKIVPGELKSPRIKKILYSTKFLYFSYLRIQKILLSKRNKKITEEEEVEPIRVIPEIRELVKYIADNYSNKSIIYVFHPYTSEDIIQLFREEKLNIIELEDDKREWSWTEADNSHWNCAGHEAASVQISDFLIENKWIQKKIN